jgi:hypothetical protein
MQPWNGKMKHSKAMLLITNNLQNYVQLRNLFSGPKTFLHGRFLACIAMLILHEEPEV